MIQSVGFRVQSMSLTCGQISALLGVEPSHCVDVGTLVSSRRPKGARHSITTWTLGSAVRGYDIAEHLYALEPVVDALANVRRQRNPSLVADVVVTVMAASSGVMLDLNAGQISRLALADCGVVVDIYEQNPVGG